MSLYLSAQSSRIGHIWNSYHGAMQVVMFMLKLVWWRSIKGSFSPSVAHQKHLKFGIWENHLTAANGRLILREVEADFSEVTNFQHSIGCRLR